jgi:hypothetical protein
MVTYVYDDAYQLTEETRTGSNAYASDYTYDDTGNRLTKVQNSVTETTRSETIRVWLRPQASGLAGLEGTDLRDAEFFDRWQNGPPWPVRPLWQRLVNNSLFQACVEPTLNRERRFGHLQASLRNSDGTLRPTLLRIHTAPMHWKSIGAVGGNGGGVVGSPGALQAVGC